MINRALMVLVLFSAVAVSIPKLPTLNVKNDKPESRECWEVREQLMDAVERGQLTLEQIQPIVNRCNNLTW